MSIKISIAEDFSPTPGGRTATDGEFSGEAFREQLLAPAIAQAIAGRGTVVVDLDGAEGFPSSFLEEAFGGLVRHHELSLAQIRACLGFTHSEPGLASYEGEIWAYIEEADQLARGPRAASM